MKTSYNWLNNYLAIPWSPEELAEKLTRIGLEAEGIHTVALSREIVIARICGCEKHPNADKLFLCDIDDGREHLTEVVCGAPDCHVGQRVIFARVGSELPGMGTIKKVTLRGVVSEGMLCSQRDLNLGEDHGVLYTPPAEASIGEPLCHFIPEDTVLSWEVTPNRPDWLSHIGIAREISSLLPVSLSLPVPSLTFSSGSVSEAITVEVQEPEQCPRYTARILDNIHVAPSPLWMQQHLRAVGIRPINNVVDITNYVLMEFGQPLHAFDLDRISGNRVIIRKAKSQENFTALDGKNYSLISNDLVISDGQKSIALAGIIGGEYSSIDHNSTKIILEGAAFLPENIRKTAKRLGISTESSYRFERGIDIDTVELASARAAQLLCQYAKGRVREDCIDIYQKKYQPLLVSCRFSRVQSLLGITIEKEKILSILDQLSLPVITHDNDECLIKIPSFRHDLQREVDIIEEIVRLYGLDRIKGKKCFSIAYHSIHDVYDRVQKVRDTFLQLGLFECMTYSLIPDTSFNKIRFNEKKAAVHVVNPLHAEASLLRPTLLPGMIETIHANLNRKNEDLRLFEVGRVFSLDSENQPEEFMEGCIAISGRKHPEYYGEDKQQHYDFFDLRGLIEDFYESIGFRDYLFHKTSHQAFQNHACLECTWNNQRIAILGELDNKAAKILRTKHAIYVAWIKLDHLIHDPLPLVKYTPIVNFPAIKRDVTFLASEPLKHQLVIDTITHIGIPILERIELLDIYRDTKVLGRKKKSMTYCLTFRSPSGTLTDEDVNQAQETIRLTLMEMLPIQIR